MPSYSGIAFKTFGSLSKSLKGYFIDLQDDLQKAGIKYTLEEYLSIALMTIFVTFFMETALFAFIFGLLGFPTVTAAFLGLTLSSTLSGLVMFLFYSYPVTISKTRGSKITKVLPFAVSYLATMSSSRLPPVAAFRTLAKFEEYGEVSKESREIVQNIEVFGMTFSNAIRRQARRTPSLELRDLFWGIDNVTSSGGNLTEYLEQKAETLMSDYRRKIRKYSQDLSLFMEVYLTLIITGSIFFIILSSIVAALSGGLGTIAIQTFIVFILIPLISLGFILLIKSISPVEE
ncbi:MAG: type II secretion system F family protein [Candidatus Aenigmarchaeota archaeon]|nr:type II secretion system F family protein [Candidatus Aenigmarchaeota archaeon]